MRLSGEQRAAIRERVEAATPGEWFWNSYSSIGAVVPKGHVFDLGCEAETGLGNIATIEDAPGWESGGDELCHPQAKANADFIAAARTDVPLLLEALEEAEREVERLRAGLVEMGRAILDRDEE